MVRGVGAEDQNRGKKRWSRGGGSDATERLKVMAEKAAIIFAAYKIVASFVH